MHEPTFRRVVEEAGLNPYLFEMANIREHCSWVHAANPKEATRKAKDLIRMAVARARLLEMLQKKGGRYNTCIGNWRIARGVDGFFQEAPCQAKAAGHAHRWNLLSWYSQGPKDITDSAAMGSASAVKAVIPLSKGKVEIEPIIAVIDGNLCSECGTCIALCQYGAIKKDENGIAKVTDVLCKGRSTCAASCPEKAITVLHFTDEQLTAQAITALGRFLHDIRAENFGLPL